MKESTIYKKWREQDEKMNYLDQVIRSIHAQTVNGINQLLLSSTVIKKVLIERGLITSKEFDEILVNEVKEQERAFQEKQDQ